MIEGVPYQLTILFSLGSGLIALILSLLLWDTLRRTPFGRAVIALAMALVLFNLYHVVALFVPESTLVTTVAKSVTLTGVVLVIGVLIILDNRLRRVRIGGKS